MEGILDLLDQEDLGFEAQALTGDIVDANGGMIKKQNRLVEAVKGIGSKIWKALVTAWNAILEKFQKLKGWLKKFAFWKKKKEQNAPPSTQSALTDNRPASHQTALGEGRQAAKRAEAAAHSTQGTGPTIPMGGDIAQPKNKQQADLAVIKSRAGGLASAYSHRDDKSGRTVLDPTKLIAQGNAYLSIFQKYTMAMKLENKEQMLNKVASYKASKQKCDALREAFDEMIQKTFTPGTYMDAKAAEDAARGIDAMIQHVTKISTQAQEIAAQFARDQQVAVDHTVQKGARKRATANLGSISQIQSDYQQASRDCIRSLGHLYSGLMEHVRGVSGAHEALIEMDGDYAMECGYDVDDMDLSTLAIESMNAEFDIDDSDADDLECVI